MRATQVCAIATLMAGPALAQESPSTFQRPGSAFGFSYASYTVEPEDGVFTDANRHTTHNFGFRLHKSFVGTRSVGWMVDAELFLGVANRELLDAPMPNTIVGMQAFVGPVATRGRFSAYTALGVNRVSVGSSEIVSVPRLVVIQYIGTGGLSSLWAAQLNALANRGQSQVIASIPAYRNVSPAGMLGMSWDLVGKPFGFRVSFDYLPVFASPTRHNIRSTFSITG